MTEDNKNSATSGLHRPVQIPGEFPFPIIEGAEEPQYLTWLRNHSNYLIQNGLTDYLRIVAVLVRGIFLNFLTLLPIFIMIAAILSVLHIALAQPQTVTFKIIPDETIDSDARIAGETGYEELQITITDTFWKTDTLTVPFDRSTGEVLRSMEFLMVDLTEESAKRNSLFSNINWSLEYDSLRAAAKRSNNEVVVSSTDLVFGQAAKEFPVRSPLMFSGLLLAVAAGIVVLYPVVVGITRVGRYSRARVTGHFSSVKRRDLFERIFGWLLFTMIVVAAFETFPLLTAVFHAFRQTGVAIAGPALAIFAVGIIVANQMLPRMGNSAKTIGMSIVSLLGLALPLLVILFVIEFLVYLDTSWLVEGQRLEYLIYGMMALPGVFIAFLVFTWLLGIRSLRLRGHMQFAVLLTMLGLILVGIRPGAEFFQEYLPNYLVTYVVVVVALEIMLYCWLAVDVNQTSINGLYRDRLASAYLIGRDTDGEIDIEQDINLQEICNYDAGSTAPYHIINVALNLQATKDKGVRDRNSDFFIFSKRFIGSDRTGYCRSENMEAVFSQMDLGTAMAISAAAASPNMGRSGKPLLAAFLTLLNIRLGFWVPHPDKLEKYLARRSYTKGDEEMMRFKNEVFSVEMDEIAKRRIQAYWPEKPRSLAEKNKPTVDHNLVGIAFSGGGIRSATINLGLVQELHRRGVLRHIDYMSSVSGGGYLASSISTLMRYKVPPNAEFDGVLRWPNPENNTLYMEDPESDPPKTQLHAFAPFADMDPTLKDGMHVRKGRSFLTQSGPAGKDRLVSLMDGFAWRVRPRALRQEMLSKLDETSDWINLSDGGHIENTGAMELLRRRCKIIIIGDGEADPTMAFNGLATLIRFARLDLGIEIDIDVDPLRLRGPDGNSLAHHTIGRIRYPAIKEFGIETAEIGYLVYFKSSLTGDEDEVINEYKDRNPSFPHESTADQLFDEGQFEAYRALGEHIGKNSLPPVKANGDHKMSFKALELWAMDNQTTIYKTPDLYGVRDYVNESGSGSSDT